MFSSSCSSWPQSSLGLHSPSCSLLHTWILQFPESYQSLALLRSSQRRIVLTFAYSLSSSLANRWERVHLFFCLREYIPILARAFKWENFVTTTTTKNDKCDNGKGGFPAVSHKSVIFFFFCLWWKVRLWDVFQFRPPGSSWGSVTCKPGFYHVSSELHWEVQQKSVDFR